MYRYLHAQLYPVMEYMPWRHIHDDDVIFITQHSIENTAQQWWPCDEHLWCYKGLCLPSLCFGPTLATKMAVTWNVIMTSQCLSVVWWNCRNHGDGYITDNILYKCHAPFQVSNRQMALLYAMIHLCLQSSNTQQCLNEKDQLVTKLKIVCILVNQGRGEISTAE